MKPIELVYEGSDGRVRSVMTTPETIERTKAMLARNGLRVLGWG
jgi:hypothetical protein